MSAYRREIEWQLNNEITCTCLPSYPTAEFSEAIKPILNKALCNSIIDEGEHKYLLQTNSVRPAFYTLPKIHKGSDNPSGCTTVSGNKSITEPLSQFFDYQGISVQPVFISERHD